MSEHRHVWVVRAPEKDLWVRFNPKNPITNKMQAYLSPWDSPEGLPTFFRTLDGETIVLMEYLSGVSPLQAIPFVELPLKE